MWQALIILVTRLLAFFFGRRAIEKRVEDEVVAEIAEHDRKRANEIRDRVDNARLGGGLQPDPADTRGYRD